MDENLTQLLRCWRSYLKHWGCVRKHGVVCPLWFLCWQWAAKHGTTSWLEPGPGSSAGGSDSVISAPTARCGAAVQPDPTPISSRGSGGPQLCSPPRPSLWWRCASPLSALTCCLWLKGIEVLLLHISRVELSQHIYHTSPFCILI